MARFDCGVHPCLRKRGSEVQMIRSRLALAVVSVASLAVAAPAAGKDSCVYYVPDDGLLLVLQNFSFPNTGKCALFSGFAPGQFGARVPFPLSASACTGGDPPAPALGVTVYTPHPELWSIVGLKQVSADRWDGSANITVSGETPSTWDVYLVPCP
jgi:hypothetical protein